MVFCHHCGNKIPVGAQFCPYCGYPVNQNSVQQPHTLYSTPRYPKHKIKILPIILISIAVIGLILIGVFGLNKYHEHVYYATNYKNLNYSGGKYSYYTNVLEKKFWQKPHYVLVKKNVKAYDISIKGADMADAYSIGSKTLKKGAVVKTECSPTSPGGFGITGKGFHGNNHKESFWVVNPSSINSHVVPTNKKSASNYWIKAVRKY